MQFDERFTYWPLERMTPPSEASKNWAGLRGCVTSRCWSGWIPFGCTGSVPSNVTSFNVSPAFVERSTPRWFATFSPYRYEPPAYTTSGCPGGV